jgi:O-antigen/teichoic acid export membrane protein
MKDAKYIRNLIFTTVMGGLMGVMNYAFNVIVARYTDSSVFSTFSTSMAFIYLLQIPSSSIMLMVTKKVGENRKYDLNKFKWNLLIIFSIIGIISALIFVLLRSIISDIASILLIRLFI